MGEAQPAAAAAAGNVVVGVLYMASHSWPHIPSQECMNNFPSSVSVLVSGRLHTRSWRPAVVGTAAATVGGK